MIKYFGRPAITFNEFPDEISLTFNISNCPVNCKNCFEPELRGDVGEHLTTKTIQHYIDLYPDISLVGFMGGDCDHHGIRELTNFIHEVYQLKVGMYSGFNYLDMDLLNCLDYYKIGEYRSFQGDESTWKDQTAGPIVLPTSNQVMFKRVENKWVNITDKFRHNKINNWNTVIIK